MSLYILQIRFRYRMLCHENGTAVLKGLNGGLIGVDFLRNLHNFLFIQSDTGTVYRQGTHLISGIKRMHGLRCHLTNTLSRNQSQALCIYGNLLCYFHHIAAHDDGQLFMRTFLIYCQLNIRKIDDVQINRPAVTGNQSGQIHHLLFCPLTGIGRCMEINCINFYPPLTDHIAGNRRIYPP